VASETVTVEVTSNGVFEFVLETQDIAIRSLYIRVNEAGAEAKIEVARLSGKPSELDSAHDWGRIYPRRFYTLHRR